jgi:hypothetical protein
MILVDSAARTDGRDRTAIFQPQEVLHNLRSTTEHDRAGQSLHRFQVEMTLALAVLADPLD